MRLILAFAVTIFSAPCAGADEKPIEIPLKDVWAVNMPGTLEIGKFNSIKAAEDSIVTKALRQVRDSWNHDKGMAVQGEGLEAVEEFYRIRTEKLPRNKVSTDSPVSLIFYTGGVGYYTHIQRIEKHGDKFAIKYRFTPHQTQDITQHLAIIPIGKVPPGKYQVKVEQLPLEKQFVELGYEKALPRQVGRVCKSFSFLVLE